MRPWSRKWPVVIAPLTTIFLALLSCDLQGTEDPTNDGPVAPEEAIKVTVHGGDQRQVMEGFGALTQSLVFQTGDNLTPSQRQRAIEAVYGRVGLTMGRLSIGLAETPADASDLWEERSNDNDDPFVIDEGGFNWFGSDAAKEKVVDSARPLGFDNYSLMGNINLLALNFLVPIRDSDYDRYLNECAEHVLAVLEHWREAYGLVPQTVYLFNEPTSGNKELSGGSAQEIADIIKRTGGRLREAGFSEVKFVVPNEETVRRTLEVTKVILEDPEARKYLAAIGYHPYPYGSPYSSTQRILETSGRGEPVPGAVERREELRTFVQAHDIPLWMTEVTQGPKNADFEFGSFENVRARAIHIHDEMVHGRASAYFGMNAMWDTETHRDHFEGRNVSFYDSQSNIALIDKETDDVHVTGMGYAIGHYARWLNRGAVRVEATSAGSLLQVTAFRDGTQNRFVLVAINNYSTEASVDVRLKTLRVQGEVTGEQSTGEERWTPISSFQPDSPQRISFSVPGRSVTTISVPLDTSN